jgi:AcrR family transcriptional regulator
MLMKQQRLKAEDRCDAIRKAMSEVFAEKGFEGTTTRDLAKAAGVSEALLYRHYPSKQAMYEAMTQNCLGQQFEEELKTMLAMEPSASTLVFLTHFLMKRMIVEAQKSSFDVLIVRSLLEDGELERTVMKARGGAWHKKVRESLQARRDSRARGRVRSAGRGPQARSDQEALQRQGFVVAGGSLDFFWPYK